MELWGRRAHPGRQKGIPGDHFWDVFGVVFANAGFLGLLSTFAPFFPSILYRFFGSFFCGLRCKSSTGRPLKIAISWCKNNDFEKIAVLENHRARLEISSKKRCQIHSKTAHRTKGEKHWKNVEIWYKNWSKTAMTLKIDQHCFRDWFRSGLFRHWIDFGTILGFFGGPFWRCFRAMIRKIRAN